ncbi:MAG: acylphosphatase [Pseudomonadales bacterium]
MSSPSSPTRAVHGRVRGRVQGVSFRASMQQQGQSHGLTGWVRNCPDGSVEFFAQGDCDAVERLLSWAQQGPAGARVDDVHVGEATPSAAVGEFEVRH